MDRAYTQKQERLAIDRQPSQLSVAGCASVTDANLDGIRGPRAIPGRASHRDRAIRHDRATGHDPSLGGSRGHANRLDPSRHASPGHSIRACTNLDGCNTSDTTGLRR